MSSVPVIAAGGDQSMNMVTPMGTDAANIQERRLP